MAKEDAVAIARLKAAGAIILGKTNVPNAPATGRAIMRFTARPTIPGMSTALLRRLLRRIVGGAGRRLRAAVAWLNIGGSLRTPAHYCGVYAHKPTFGLVPLRGHTPPGLPPLPFDRDLSVVGPMAISALDLALALDVIAGPDEWREGMAYRLALPAPRHEELKLPRLARR